MLRLCSLVILLAMTAAMPQNTKWRTTLDPAKEHKNEGSSSDWSPSDLSMFEEWIRGYPEHRVNKEQAPPVETDRIQPATAPSSKEPPRFLADYEAQDFVDEDLEVPEDDNPNKYVDEYPDSETPNVNGDQHSSDIQSNAQAWFDSLDENTSKYSAEDIASFRGIPGVNFPDYEDIPLTQFNCFDKQYLPGFYADMDTGCQVFHMCFDNRKVSFLCPVGTVFNQALLTCDYWNNSNCSRTPLHYSSNVGLGHNPHQGQNPHDESNHEKQPADHASSVDTSEEIVPETQVHTPGTNHGTTNTGAVTSEVNQGNRPSGKPHESHDDHSFSGLRYLDLFLRFFPIKAKVTMLPHNGQTKVVATTSIGNSMRQRISVYPVANNSKIVAEASIGEKRRQNRPRAGGYSAVTQAPETHDQRKSKDIDQSVFNDVDDAFAIVRRILEHVGRIIPTTTSETGDEENPSTSPVSGRWSSCRCRPRHQYPRPQNPHPQQPQRPRPQYPHPQPQNPHNPHPQQPRPQYPHPQPQHPQPQYPQPHNPQPHHPQPQYPQPHNPQPQHPQTHNPYYPRSHHSRPHHPHPHHNGPHYPRPHHPRPHYPRPHYPRPYNRQPGRPKHCRCPHSLPTLNPRFIVQPVKI